MDKVTRQVSTNHNFFWRERRAEAVSNRGPSAYQPKALPLGQTGSRTRKYHYRGLCTLSRFELVWGYPGLCCRVPVTSFERWLAPFVCWFLLQRVQKPFLSLLMTFRWRSERFLLRNRLRVTVTKPWVNEGDSDLLWRYSHFPDACNRILPGNPRSKTWQRIFTAAPVM